MHTYALNLGIVLVLSCCYRGIYNFPHNSNSTDPEIIVTDEILHYTDVLLGNSSVSSSGALLTFDEPNLDDMQEDNESTIDPTEDDLIFLTKKPRRPTLDRHGASTAVYDGGAYREIDLLASHDARADEGEDNKDTFAAANLQSADHHSHAGGSGVVCEIELHADDTPHVRNISPTTTDTLATQRTATAPPIDMSDFVALVPMTEVTAIAANYYRNDAEVQRAYAFLNSRDFTALSQHIIAVPEMSAFLKYFNNSGLDVVEFFYTLTNLTTKVIRDEVVAANTQPASTTVRSSARPEVLAAGANFETGNEIERIRNVEKLSMTPSAATEASPTTTTTPKEQLNGLHGLVDSIRDVLPQDQILATFFDKLETNEQFSKLVDSLGSPAFAEILHNMENSLPLRNLIFTLHNNGIYITRIVDSLKAYFFLGTF